MRTFTAIEVAKEGRRNFIAGIIVGLVATIVIAAPLAYHLAFLKYRKVLVENGCAYYDAQSGDFVLIRNENGWIPK